MKIMVVGGAGYIGSHVVRALLDRGHEAAVFDDLSTGCRENLFEEAEFVEGTILDEASLGSALDGGYDGIVHLAAFKAAGESMTEPEKYAVNNLSGTINLLNATVKAGIPRLVFSSSAAVYGAPTYLPIDESHPLEPENFYGFTKLEIERLLHWYAQLRGIGYAALRYFNAVGYDRQGRIRGVERKTANLMPIVMEVAIGRRPGMEIFGEDYDTRDGTCVRDYVHVSDLADAHVRALERLEGRGEHVVVNLGSQSGVSVKEMIDAARRITGKSIPATVVGRRPGDPAKLIASSKKAHEVLGWKAECSDVDTVIATMWDAYKGLGDTDRS